MGIVVGLVTARLLEEVVEVLTRNELEDKVE